MASYSHPIHFYTVLETPALSPEEQAWLNIPARPGKLTFADRCNVVRAESYKRQQERNARFEHLRNLLCKPTETPAMVSTSPGDVLRERIAKADRARFEESTTKVRCTCRCRVRSHQAFVLCDPTPGSRVWGCGDPKDAQANYDADGTIAHCEDCYLDRIDPRCKAVHHWRSLEEPDSSTVKTDEDDAPLLTVTARLIEEKEANAYTIRNFHGIVQTHLSPKKNALLHDGWAIVEQPEAREPESADPTVELGAKATKLTGIRDIDVMMERRGPKHALIIINPETRYLTIQYGAKKRCKLTMNATSLVLTVKWTDAEGVEHTKRSEPYPTMDALEEARDRLAEWLLEDGDKTPNMREDIQQATTRRYETTARMYEKTRTLRDLMDAKGIETRVWNPTRKESV